MGKGLPSFMQQSNKDAPVVVGGIVRWAYLHRVQELEAMQESRPAAVICPTCGSQMASILTTSSGAAFTCCDSCGLRTRMAP